MTCNDLLSLFTPCACRPDLGSGQQLELAVKLSRARSSRHSYSMDHRGPAVHTNLTSMDTTWI